MTALSTSTFTMAPLDQLPTVTLAELTASAALLTRVDRK